MFPRQIQSGGRSFGVVYERVSGRTSSVGISGDKVVIKLSRFARDFDTEKMVVKFLKWAGKRLAKADGLLLLKPEYRDGGKIFTHNKSYDLVVHLTDRKNSKVVLKDGIIGIFLGKVFVEKLSEKGRERVIKGLAEDKILEDQMPYLCEVIHELNELYFKEKINVCRFKKTNHRFGSLSRKGNLNISFRLLFAPREVFRYVCVHELSHLKEFNHSKRFWAVVASVMPNYKDSEKWLKNNGFMLG